MVNPGNKSGTVVPLVKHAQDARATIQMESYGPIFQKLPSTRRRRFPQ